MKNKDIIVKIKFDTHTMLFGNSHKPWKMQFEEYLIDLYRNGMYPNNIEEVLVSDEPWVKWGGLKWCTETRFQNQLNREGCQGNDPDNPNPRQYSDMEFYKSGVVTKKVISIFANVRKGIY
ncbi:spore protein H [Paenibacillus sp. NAIST15-1]|uniref:spore protein H n=1 Tax=Paenibacillus sp. NAIST15-1 TaxID=1605994 RepID=UPI00086EE2DA|nr:spore protein H [Paenibacillus sp. NAIST15-1]GAV11449.1 hypothetical protein PBN151_1378 [Paenibacillus sp. NAIST15-1]